MSLEAIAFAIFGFLILYGGLAYFLYRAIKARSS
ncbi:MAG: MetS family NSS transporter small subunit [Archaeoglobales archaeon]|jgi:hypothetical protein|nr:MetS family NSS transporter small subunit [Archaeoglobales archaeon]TDA25010.1 MAG: hypothetical protein DSO01_08630 [Archaeoglobi archaeon]TDA25695.1 MAG: hypothetical protein DSN99_07775 [Archaeoglobi archaeon]TDA25705.1 MAG: hypothetical protein DSO00_08380 [Archaeoglobi archaeon]